MFICLEVEENEAERIQEHENIIVAPISTTTTTTDTSSNGESKLLKLKKRPLITMNFNLKSIIFFSQS